MKKSDAPKLSFLILIMVAIFTINGCKKEAIIKTIAPVTVSNKTVDSATFLKGEFDGLPISFEGNTFAYHGYVDPDSAGHGGNQAHDNDAFYQSGSKWVTLTTAGIQVTNASLELRSLAVRVFVSPIAAAATDYYNLLTPSVFPVANDDNSSKGGYLTLHDSHGVIWTTRGDQDGSSLVILTRDVNMSTYTVVTGTISAKMYDGEGNMKKLTNALFTAALGI